MPGHDEQGMADPPQARFAHAVHDARRGKRGEARLPPTIAVLVAVALYAVLPEPLLVGPRLLIPGLELVLLAVLIATNPWRLTRQTRWSRAASLVLAGLVAVSNLVTYLHRTDTATWPFRQTSDPDRRSGADLNPLGCSSPDSCRIPRAGRGVKGRVAPAERRRRRP